MNKKGFTLIELLAVIVILAVILVIAVPRINDVISSAKTSSIEGSVKLMAKNAERVYQEKTILGESTDISCSDVVTYSSNDYENCTIEFSDNIAYVTIVGKGKFSNIACVGGTTNDAMCETKIPNTYSRVAYLRSPENAYIDTGFKPNNNTTIEVKATMDFNKSICGVQPELVITTNGILHPRFRRNGAVTDFSSTIWDGTMENIHVYKISNTGKISIDNCSYGSVSPGTTFTSNYSMYLFGRNNNGSLEEPGGNSKIYYFRAWDSSNLVRDMVPVKRKSDNKPGMLDILTNTFYTNQGTDADFTTGDVIY